MESDNKRIARNTLFLYIRMFFVLLISLYISRVLLTALGVEDYGVYNVVAGFVLLFGFLNATLSSSVQRFFNYEGTKNVENGVQNVYCNSFFIHFFISSILFILLESFGLWYINNIMVLPAERLFAANVVFQSSVVSAIIIIMQTPYIGIIMAKEKMDFYAYISIFDIVAKLFIAIFIKYTNSDKLICYSLLLLLITIADYTLYFLYAKNIARIKLNRHIDKGLLRQLLSFSGWNLFGTLIFMLRGQGINMLLNIFFGPLINAAYGVASQVSSALSGFSSNLMTAYRPQVVNAYASNNIDRLKYLMFSETRICFFLFVVIVIPIIFELDNLLHLWLGNAIPLHANIFVELILIDSLICILNQPCTQVVFAVGNIKRFQIITGLINALIIPTSYIALKYTDIPSIVFIVMIIISIINQIAALILTNKVFNFGIIDYCKRVLKPCLLTVCILPLCIFIIISFINESYLRLLVVCIADLLVSIPIFYYIIAEDSERDFVRNKFKNI